MRTGSAVGFRMGVVLVATVFSGWGALAAEPTADEIAQEIFQTQFSPATMEEVYKQAAKEASNAFQLTVQPKLKRAFSEDEKQRLFLFWHTKMKEALPYEAIEGVVAPVLAKNVSLEDLQEISRFTQSPAGRRLAEVQAVIMREAATAGEELGRKIADKQWQAKTLEELKREFPQWFQANPESE